MQKLRFETDDGISLEGELRLPDAAPVASAVICHAHPQMGGSKDHPILWAIRNDLARRGFAVLAFNFRGTMGSGGEHGDGDAEVADVWAAVGRVQEEAPGPPVFVAGWSFGAHVAVRAAVEDDRVGALALVAIPTGEVGRPYPALPSAEDLRDFRPRALFVSGDADSLSRPAEVEALAARFPEGAARILEGADHFFGRREKELAEIVGSFAAEAIGAGGRGDAS